MQIVLRHTSVSFRLQVCGSYAVAETFVKASRHNSEGSTGCESWGPSFLDPENGNPLGLNMTPVELGADSDGSDGMGVYGY